MKWLLAILLAAAPAVPQERADAPWSWTRHKPGTSRKTRTTVSTGATSETLLTLKEITEKEAVLDMVTFTAASKDGRASVLRLPLFRLGEKIADETLKFKDADTKCRVLKATCEFSGMKTESKYWVADGIDFPLKTLEVTSGAQSWMNVETESRLVGLDEELTVSGRKLKCAKYEGSSKGGRNATTTTWLCAEIPGGLARTESEIDPAGSKLKMVIETIEFEVKK